MMRLVYLLRIFGALTFFLCLRCGANTSGAEDRSHTPTLAIHP